MKYSIETAPKKKYIKRKEKTKIETKNKDNKQKTNKYGRYLSNYISIIILNINDPHEPTEKRDCQRLSKCMSTQ